MGKPYVTGFLLNPSGNQVVLIRKKHPEWQAGKLNGVGGKIEPIDPSALDAMIREFREETGATISSWIPYARLHNLENDHTIFYFVAVDERNLKDVVKTTTDEEIEIHSLHTMLSMSLREPLLSKSLGEPTVFSTPNIPWLISMACTFIPPRQVTRMDEVLSIEGWWKTGQKD